MSITLIKSVTLTLNQIVKTTITELKREEAEKIKLEKKEIKEKIKLEKKEIKEKIKLEKKEIKGKTKLEKKESKGKTKLEKKESKTEIKNTDNSRIQKSQLEEKRILELTKIKMDLLVL